MTQPMPRFGGDNFNGGQQSIPDQKAAQSLEQVPGPPQRQRRHRKQQSIVSVVLFVVGGCRRITQGPEGVI